MAKTANVGRAVGPVSVDDGQVLDSQIELSRAEEEIEVAEWIQVSEVGSRCCNPFVVRTEKDFCATQRILDPLLKYGAERPRKELVRA